MNPTGKKMTYEDMLQLAPPLEREKLIKDMLIYGTAIFDRDKKKRIDPAGKKIEKTNLRSFMPTGKKMKEIKFRAWDKEEKLMLYDIQLYLEHKDKDGNEYDGYEDWKFDDFLTDSDIEVMQFTGLLDKNGKEIYEGDILRTDADEEYISAVAYEQAGFKVDSYQDKDVCEHLENIAPHHSAEVIGNIYENPELLDS